MFKNECWCGLFDSQILFTEATNRLCLSPPITVTLSGFSQTHSTFSHSHKVGNNGIVANFVFPFICSFLHYFELEVLVNVKLDGKRDYISMLETLLVLLILNGTAKKKLTILAFLYCGEFVKTSNIGKNGNIGIRGFAT